MKKFLLIALIVVLFSLEAGAQTINGDLIAESNLPTFEGGAPNIFRVNAQNIAVSASARAVVVFARYYESTDNGLAWSTADFNTYTTTSTASNISMVHRADNNKVFSAFVNQQWDNDIHFFEGDFDNNLLTRSGWDANISLGFGIDIDPERWGMDLNAGNFLTVCGGEVGGTNRVQCRFVNTDLNTSDISNWGDVEESFSTNGGLQSLEIHSDSNSNLFLMYSVTTNEPIRMRVKYDVNGSWSNDLNISADLNADLQWRNTGSSFVETDDGNLVVLLSALNGAPTNDATVLRFCDDGAEACISDLSNWDTYENVYDGNFLFWGSLAKDTNNNIYMIGTDCQNGLCNTDTGLGYRIFNDLNKSVSGKRFIADNNSVLDTTKFSVTTSSDENGLIDIAYLASDSTLGTASLEYFQIFGDSNISILTASFTTSPSTPFVLTPTISNVAVDLNSTTLFFPSGRIVDINYLWQIDGEEISTDQNLVRDFNGADADFNISLIVSGNDNIDTFTSQSDQNVSIVNVLQTFDINFGLNVFTNNADINIGGTFGGGTTLINFIVWGGTDLDENRSGLQFSIDYNAGGIKQICGVFNTSGDINTVFCESFNITEVLVKIPLDEEVPATTLTTFTIAVDGTAPQNYSTQSADLNVFAFDQNTNQYININVDFNASYFPRNYGIFTGQPNNLFFTIQPYLALVANSIQVNWITQDVLANSSLSNIKIRSQRSIASILTEVESPFTDITGLATLTFIPQITYTLTFDLNGVTLGSGVYIPASSDTQKKAFLDVTDINTGTFIQSALDVNFTPGGGVIVLPSDFNATTITQDINVFDGNLSSLRILVTHGSATLSDTNHTAPGTFTQTLALSGRDLNTLVIVRITAVISGQSFFIEKVYGLRTTPGLTERFTTSKDQDIGHTGATLLAVILTAVAIGGLIGLNRTENQDNSSLSLLAIPILMFFAFLNWVSWIPIIFGSAAAIILFFSSRASKGGFA